MIKRWLNKAKDYPEYWNQYESLFKIKQEKNIDKITFVVFDTETTGFDFKNDKVISIGAVTIQKNSIQVSNTFEVYIDQSHFNPDTVKIHGILKKGANRISEAAALKLFLAYIKNAVIIAHHATFDITMINMMLKRAGLPNLKNRVLDTGILYKKTRLSTTIIDHDKYFSLDELAALLNVSKKDRHTAAGDAYITAIIFLKIISRLKKKQFMRVKDLF